MKPLKDMTGQTFGKWKVLQRGPNTKQGQAQWVCICACGRPQMIKGSHLRQRRSTQCKMCHNSTFNRRHGKYKTSTYQIWEAMIQRCTNPNDRSFDSYGGRGIDVCEAWRSDFMNFWADMGDRPKNLTLERNDNEKGYSKSNCKWATRTEQLNNTRRSRRPGDIFKTWVLKERIDSTSKSKFECIHCKREWISETYYITSGNAAACKCT